MRNILIADDDQEIANLIRIYLQNEGFQITELCPLTDSALYPTINT
jgi:DNA-binding response OmpR family regulator